ncbi:MAG TPA: glutamate racemase [Syntrophomonadaceae bacterium]|nr:glutamate racemase [Syntrophomonadaceae bacterium]
MEKTQPIGVFDSGVGGLTVVKSLWEHFPQEQIVYFGDTAHLPYGSHSPEQIIHFGLEIVEFLLDHTVKAVIAACNTSSSVSLSHLQEKSPVPVIGMVEPGVQAALRKTKNKRIGVLATKPTVESGAYERVFRLSDPDVQVFTQSCPLFVPLVENGRTGRRETYQIARSYLQPLQEAEVDTLVFGCTHYPFLAPVIKHIIGEGIQLVDPAKEVVSELAGILKLDGHRGETPKHLFYASGSITSFYTTGKEFLGSFPFKVQQVSLNSQVKGAPIGNRDIENEGLLHPEN